MQSSGGEGNCGWLFAAETLKGGHLGLAFTHHIYIFTFVTVFALGEVERF